MSFPFFGKQFSFSQPDGTKLEVRGWGDQNAAVFETLDGYTVTRNPVTRFYEFATLNADETELLPSGVRANAFDPQRFGLAARVRVRRKAAVALAEAGSGLPKSRWQERREEARLDRAVKAATAALTTAAPSRATVGDYVGLCLPVQFPDVGTAIGMPELEAFCNQTGYTGFGNRGSVFDYFFDNSMGKVRYRTIVAPFCTASHPRAYYTDPQVNYGARARELVREAVLHHAQLGFDFSSLTVDRQGLVYATNLFYAGPVVNNHREGLWPHQSKLIHPVSVGAGGADRRLSGYEYWIGTHTGDVLPRERPYAL